ncbi:serine/threonine protein kinase [Myxococcota bacterium]|nr:serine/threonine protein kinase [Myxococcota bacterium]
MARLCPKCFERFDDETRRCPTHGKNTVEDLSGQIVAERYELRDLLGVGGMNSTVWVAWHAATHRHVALKLLPPTHASAAERFARGARLASNLSHPHITVVHDYGQSANGGLFLVMELLEGVPLHQALKREGAMAPERVLRLSEQVLRALDHAHRKHIVHRDLKPGNLFLLSNHGEDEDFVKVLDFGIAKAFEGDDGDDTDAGALSNLSSEVTHQRQVCGTPHYMAPEQVAMGRVDARTDLYSLGVVMYRMLMARLPFEGKETHELFRMHLTEPPMLFRTARPDLEIPAAIEAVVMRALAKDPDDRFGSAAEMRAAVREVRRGLGLLSEEDSMSGPPSMPGVPSARATMNPRPAPPPEVQAAVTIDLPVPARTRKPGLFVGLGGAALLFALGLWWALRANPDEAAPVRTGSAPASGPTSGPGPGETAANAPPADVAVEIESTPAGANVRTALRPLGTTPLRVTLPRDTDTVFLELAGHATKALPVDLKAVAAEERVKYHVVLDITAPTPATATAAAAPRPARAAPPPVEPAPIPPSADVVPRPSAPPVARPGLIDPDDPRSPAAAPARPAAAARSDDDTHELLDVTPAAQRPGPKPEARPSRPAVELLE